MMVQGQTAATRGAGKKLFQLHLAKNASDRVRDDLVLQLFVAIHIDITHSADETMAEQKALVCCFSTQRTHQ